jgi:hypothetical protein
MDNRRRAAALVGSGAAIIPAALLMTRHGNISDTSAGLIVGLVIGCQIAALILFRRMTTCPRG